MNTFLLKIKPTNKPIKEVVVLSENNAFNAYFIESIIVNSIRDRPDENPMYPNNVVL